MAKYLVIVESPAKVKTIKKFLGSNYQVAASNGHVRDLPKSSLGIDVEHDYEPKYITIRGKGDILANLRKEVRKAEKIYLATDPDREGEAISWHLLYALKLEEKLKEKKVYRITFNEITKNAVKESLKNAREINMNLVDAQQARRMLDRMVGYRISPLLWKKVKRGLSAGRVQSVALRIICDREEEIDAFIPEEYWTLDVNLDVKGEKKPICAKYYGTAGEKKGIACKEEADRIMASLKGAEYTVREVKKGERHKKPPLPFTTSTLQQEASRALNFSTQKTMRLAQQLYEGVDIEGEGTVGLITYLRTDSTRVSREAEDMAAEFIAAQYGKKYLAEAAGEKEKEAKLPPLTEGQRLESLGFAQDQHFTQPPAHYTEASLVRALEELGIGRPSTYAPTITTILARRYVVKEEKNLYVTELGEVVNHMMKEAFPSIVDVHFTASMEALLDSVEEGDVKWKTVVSNFYPDLDEAVQSAEKELAEVSIADEVSDEECDLCGRMMVIKYGPHGRFLACPGFPECRNTKPYFEKIGVACPKCGKDVVLKKTKKGRKYYGCIDNPECDFMSWQKPSGESCPRCGGPLLIKGNKLVCSDAQCGYHILSELSNKSG